MDAQRSPGQRVPHGSPWVPVDSWMKDQSTGDSGCCSHNLLVGPTSFMRKAEELS